MFCPHCGSQIADGSKFCPSCGQSIGGPSAQAPQQPYAQQPYGQQPAQPAQPNQQYYQQPAAGGYQTAAGTAGAHYGQLRTDRSLLIYVLLSLVTCGIYSFFFLAKWIEDINVVCDGDGKRTPGLIEFILLTLVTCGLYSIYWYYTLGNRLYENAPRYGLHFSENGTSVLLWMLIGSLLCGMGPLVALNFLIRNTNDLCSAYNRNH